MATTTRKRSTKSSKTTKSKALASKTKSTASAKGKSLVIVESPAKAKTINKYLGNDYIVRSSIGHVRDLPTSGSAKTKSAKAKADDAKLSKEEKAQLALVRRMGIDPEHGWQAVYEVLPNKTKVIKELKSLAKDADTIYLATDLTVKQLPGT